MTSAHVISCRAEGWGAERVRVRGAPGYAMCHRSRIVQRGDADVFNSRDGDSLYRHAVLSSALLSAKAVYWWAAVHDCTWHLLLQHVVYYPDSMAVIQRALVHHCMWLLLHASSVLRHTVLSSALLSTRRVTAGLLHIDEQCFHCCCLPTVVLGRVVHAHRTLEPVTADCTTF